MKIPSHYCREETEKQYLEPVFETYMDLYRELYKLFYNQNNFPIASLTTLKLVFKLIKLSFYSPKRDQYDLCMSYKVGNVREEDYQRHQDKKNAARDAKKQDVLECHQTDKTVVIFVDLQKVLLSSSLNASAIYYKTRLCSFNYTVYDAKNHQAMCYIWSECATDLSSNTFGCLIYDYLLSNER